MKEVARRIIHKFGFNVTRVNKSPELHKINQYYTPDRDENNLLLFKTPIGNYFVPPRVDTDVIIQHMARGEYFEKAILDIASQHIKKSSAVLDIGSNFGQMATFFSSLVGEDGKVYAFDADDFVFSVLEKNLAENNCTNVISTFGAVMNESGKTLIFPKQDFLKFGAYGSYGLNPLADEGRAVKSLTIDSMNIPEPISFMKVDVQGSDLAAMRGAVNTIRKNRMPILFEFEQQFQDRFRTSFQDYVDFVNEIDYTFSEVILDINYLILPR